MEIPKPHFGYLHDLILCQKWGLRDQDFTIREESKKKKKTVVTIANRSPGTGSNNRFKAILVVTVYERVVTTQTMVKYTKFIHWYPLVAADGMLVTEVWVHLWLVWL